MKKAVSKNNSKKSSTNNSKTKNEMKEKKKPMKFWALLRNTLDGDFELLNFATDFGCDAENKEGLENDVKNLSKYKSFESLSIFNSRTGRLIGEKPSKKIKYCVVEIPDYIFFMAVSEFLTWEYDSVNVDSSNQTGDGWFDAILELNKDKFELKKKYFKGKGAYYVNVIKEQKS